MIVGFDSRRRTNGGFRNLGKTRDDTALQQKFLVHVFPMRARHRLPVTPPNNHGANLPPLNPWLIHRADLHGLRVRSSGEQSVENSYWNWTRLLTLVMVNAQVGALLTRPNEIRLGYQPSSTLK